MSDTDAFGTQFQCYMAVLITISFCMGKPTDLLIYSGLSKVFKEELKSCWCVSVGRAGARRMLRTTFLFNSAALPQEPRGELWEKKTLKCYNRCVLMIIINTTTGENNNLFIIQHYISFYLSISLSRFAFLRRLCLWLRFCLSFLVFSTSSIVFYCR